MNVDLTKSTNNVHYKRCETTYNEKLKEMLDNGQVSLRGLRDNAKLFEQFQKINPNRYMTNCFIFSSLRYCLTYLSTEWPHHTLLG